ncbi:unnamed protein product [Brassicogethes aeneus]|uniref:HMG box domain-containing protein n=1 Tax=Brassicogethes aeneus TaxID=1431903 RepID=A0A9P0FK90_BRAAE|nr:unnamed protein product [Brassicogethes aeneus]
MSESQGNQQQQNNWEASAARQPQQQQQQGGENNMWYNMGGMSADQHQQLMQQQQLAAQIDAAASSSSSNPAQQLFSYKMSNSFQNAPTTVSSSVRGFEYRPAEGMPNAMQHPQWWYPPSSMDNMHNTLQSLQNSMQQSLQQQQQPPAHSPPPSSEESQRQQHQQDVDRQRHHQEALQQHHQAIAEAQVRHHQLQQQAQHLQQQLQNNHHQQQQHNQHNNQSVLQQHQQVTTNRPSPKGRSGKHKEGGKPRGPMTGYAFFVQTCREEHKKQHPEENVVFLEFSKKCAERWKTMVDNEKKRFQEMAEGDKKRYDAEMQNYIPPKGEKVKGKKRKQIKDPNAPKRSLSAFFWFSNEERGSVKAQNPEYGVGDIAKELGRRWADADPELKSKYEQLAAKDKARYDIEMTAYKQKNNPALQKAPVPEILEDVEDDEVD